MRGNRNCFLSGQAARVLQRLDCVNQAIASQHTGHKGDAGQEPSSPTRVNLSTTTREGHITLAAGPPLL